MNPMYTPATMAKNYFRLLLLLPAIGLSLLLSAPQAIAQSETGDAELSEDSGPSRIGVGVAGGVNISKYYGDTLSDQLPTNSRYAPYGGLRFTYMFSDDVKSQFFLETGLMYASKGVKRHRFSELDNTVEGLDSSVTVNITDQVDYLQLPVMARVELGSGMVRPFVSLGAVAGYNLIADRTVDSTFEWKEYQRGDDAEIDSSAGLAILNSKENTLSETAAIEDQGSFEVGAILKAGLTVSLNEHFNLIFEARYDLGFTPIREDRTFTTTDEEGNEIEKTEESTLRTQTIGFGLNLDYRF
jgi:outer membrane protein W